MASISFRARVALWLASGAVGGAIVALPDSDERLFSLNALHGPSPLDAVGIVVVLAGYAACLAALVARRRAVAVRAGRRGLAIGAAVAALGLVALLVGLAGDSTLDWVPGALVLLGVQLAAAWAARDAPEATAGGARHQTQAP